MQKATGTLEYPFRERHLLAMSTCTASLRCVGGIDLDELPTSFFRFVEQMREKGRPRRVADTLRKIMIMNHSVDHQIFDTDDAKTVNDTLQGLPQAYAVVFLSDTTDTEIFYA